MNDTAVNDTAGLRAEVLALLLEPLGVDAVAGPASLERLAKGVEGVAGACGCAGLPPSGTTLHWVSVAVAACIEEQELVRLATARGRTLTLGEARALRGLMRLEGFRPHLQALEGLPVKALRADLAAVALAERVLPGVLEQCRRADQGWPKEIWRSIFEIDVDRAVTDLRRHRRGSRQAAAARELVLNHSVCSARDLRNPELVTRLAKVQDFVAAKESYQAVLSVQPEWWRWLGPDARFRFRSDRRDALVWAIGARDTGAASGSTLEMLADSNMRAVIEQGLVTAPVSTTASAAAPAMSSAARLVTGLPAVASRTDISELRALESWYAKDVELFDRVAAAMDVRRTEPDLRAALESLVGELAYSLGAVDASRSAYRDIQSALWTEVEARLQRTSYSAHAMESEHLVGVISRIGALERELHDAVRTVPAVGGRLLVAIAGRTKSGKTTLRKALMGDADRTGIGRGAHRTTRKTSAFDVGSVTYLDTPGVAAKDDDFDAQHARDACDSADAVIWNYADTLRDEESAELQRLLLSGKPLLAVVNVKGLVNTPVRLELFADHPNREFKSAPEHAVRIEQVARAVGVAPPVILAVHSGAAHEALSTEDRELADKALRASRLPELERSLQQLLAERAIPLRAVRLAEGVRAPLAAIHDRLTVELPRIDLALGKLERSAPDERAALLESFRTAGRNTRDRLEAERHRAKERLPDVVRELGGADHAQRWSDFVTGLDLEALVSSLESDLDQEARKRGKVLRARARGPEPQDDEQLDVRPRPDVKPGSVSTAAAKGAVTALLDSVAARGIPKKLASPPVMVADYVLTPLTGAAKAVSSEVERLRQARDEWTGETTAAAEAKLDELFDGVEAQVARIVDDTTAHVGAQCEAQSADIGRTRKRFKQLRRLWSAVRSALDAIDLVLVRRLLALAGGDPATVRSARRTPGVELRVWTDASSVADVRACLQERIVDVLTERIEICSDSMSGDGDGTAHD
ncbi:50S ribosome-binding GTPase [Streptomyces sp. CRPSP2-6A1]|uniref:GTPase n=1 Tax=Streptomyces sp. CRPSP2-6A1 TaxID=2799588 RepID=UPI0018F0FED6|nr:GTPase [Streptomyces sp. CRPSP2-6A1]MBJ7000100.1 50S ribosome-binding GTPase [Streptomyces sp. CRPSP2-6A1]